MSRLLLTKARVVFAQEVRDNVAIWSTTELFRQLILRRLATPVPLTYPDTY